MFFILIRLLNINALVFFFTSFYFLPANSISHKKTKQSKTEKQHDTKKVTNFVKNIVYKQVLNTLNILFNNYVFNVCV